MQNSVRQGGFVLLVVIWVLALLSVLAAVFIGQASIEKEISRNYTDDQVANIMAQSGIERGISDIQTTLKRGMFNQQGMLEVSMFGKKEIDMPEGKIELYIQDLQGSININDGYKHPKTHSINKNLERILDILGTQVNVAKLGATLLDKRPSNGFMNDYDVKRAIGNENYDRVKNNITIFSWSNNKVCSPVPLSLEEESNYPIKFSRPNNIYRYGHGKDIKGNLINKSLRFWKSGDGPMVYDSAIITADSLNPQWIEIVERSPVNINTASKEVLTALVTGLEGFYVMEKRIPTPKSLNFYPASYDKAYVVSHNYHPDRDDNFYDRSKTNSNKVSDDTYGVLYRTGALPVSQVVDAVVKAREKTDQYKDALFAGSFETWTQFNLFADDLVKKGLFVDSTSFIGYEADPSWNIIGNDKNILQPKESNVQRRISSQAMADVLKANFNPNLHLNELNPDRNLYTLVDKTDLLINSTEFCFTPMGYFGIESSAKTMRNDSVIAIRTKKCTLKAFDVYHETSQSDFYQGTFGARKTNPTTNNNCAVETGPEPDNGKGPIANNYSGYVALSTIGGGVIEDNTGVQKLKGELWTAYSQPDSYPAEIKRSKYLTGNMAETEGHSSDFHAHFQLDHCAHNHKFGPTECLPAGPFERKVESISHGAAMYPRVTTFKNHIDKNETLYSPYSPASDINGKHTLCKVMREGENIINYSQSDLRIDGAYFEPNSAIGFSRPSTFNLARFPNLEKSGSLCMWVKPNFMPESTGRVRTIMSANPYGFFGSDIFIASGLYFFPSYNSKPYPYFPLTWYDSPVRTCISVVNLHNEIMDPESIGGKLYLPIFKMKGLTIDDKILEWVWTSPFASDALLVQSDTVNYEFTNNINENFDRYMSVEGKYNLFRKNEWIFVKYESLLDKTQNFRCRYADLYINDIKYDHKVSFIDFHIDVWNNPMANPAPRLYYGPFIMLGGEITSVHMSKMGFYRNSRTYFADSTIDEFYFWIDQGDKGRQSSERIWSYGRYYKPLDDQQDDAIFTSKTIVLANSPQTVQVIGISWTCYAEDYDSQSKPVFYNCQDVNTAMKPADLIDVNGYTSDSVCLMYIKVNGQRVGGALGNEGYSGINNVDATQIQYETKFRCGITDRIATGLLATPVLDDVTIYYTTGVKTLSYYDVTQ